MHHRLSGSTHPRLLGACMWLVLSLQQLADVGPRTCTQLLNRSTAARHCTGKYQSRRLIAARLLDPSRRSPRSHFIQQVQAAIGHVRRNIKHAFFQPAKGEMIVLLHFRLKNPIMLNKRKVEDVQCYAEVMDTVQTLDAGRRSMYDPDELEDEQRERELRSKVPCVS